MKLILTCEHGGNHIPQAYTTVFKDSEAVINTHRAYDLGALDLFRYLKPLSDFSCFSETSRLVIELNRSLHHKKLFSEYSKQLSKQSKQHLIEQYYFKYRNPIAAYIKKEIDQNQTVIHVAIHSFTPYLNGIQRLCDIGLLFDSSKPKESEYCKHLKQSLKQENKTLNVRFNYPYLGKSDGLTTHMRKQFPKRYLGIELEVNQNYTTNNTMPLSLKKTIYKALEQTLKLK